MYELRNGILYDTGIDEEYQDLITDDLIPEEAEMQNGTFYDTGADEMYSDAMSETSGGGYEFRNGIMYDTGVDSMYNEIVTEVPPVIDHMEEVNMENIENGNLPPLYDGFASNPYYDPGWSEDAFEVMDAVDEMMTMDPVKYTLD